jgi:hypothetical protein
MPIPYTSDPWKAYAGWMSPAWASPRKDFDAAEWCDKLRTGGFENVVVHAKHHDGICFFPSRFRRIQPEKDWFGEIVTEARRRDMGVVTYYSTFLGTISANEHPEQSCREMDGSLTELTCFPFAVSTTPRTALFCWDNFLRYRKNMPPTVSGWMDSTTPGFHRVHVSANTAGNDSPMNVVDRWTKSTSPTDRS